MSGAIDQPERNTVGPQTRTLACVPGPNACSRSTAWSMRPVGPCQSAGPPRVGVTVVFGCPVAEPRRGG